MKNLVCNVARWAAARKDGLFVFVSAFLLLMLGSAARVHAGDPPADGAGGGGGEAAAALDQVVEAISGVLPILSGILIAFGVVTIAIGVSQDSPADKQKGALAVVGGGLVAFAATLL